MHVYNIQSAYFSNSNVGKARPKIHRKKNGNSRISNLWVTAFQKKNLKLSNFVVEPVRRNAKNKTLS